jgi:predicted phosphate transport protein (TIGR00153 family)
MMLAVDRRDLLELLAMQDSIADTAQDIAGLLVERKMEVPEGMAEPLMRFVTRCVETCEQAHKIIEELDELLEMGFRGREVDQVNAMVLELGHMESDTDVMGMALTRCSLCPGRQHQAGVGGVLVPVDPVGRQSGRQRRESRRPPALC